MSERSSSLLILIGGVVVLVALWLLSVLAVRWDTNRRVLSEFKCRVWLVLSILLPLFGFLLYLSLRLVRSYISSPLPGNNNGDDGLLTEVEPSTSLNQDHPPVIVRGPDVPEPAWGKAPPGRSNGAHAQHYDVLPATAVTAMQHPLGTGYMLAVLKGPYLGKQFILSKLPALIGRGPEASIQLDADLNVSRSHAEIYQWNGKLRIRDLHSLHGMWVNDLPSVDQVLRSGDRVTVGGTVLVLQEME